MKEGPIESNNNNVIPIAPWLERAERERGKNDSPDSNNDNVIPMAPGLEEAERARREEEFRVPVLAEYFSSSVQETSDEQKPSKEREKSDSFEQFQKIVFDLGLTREDLKKVTLDIGAGFADYAKWVKEIYDNDQVYSVDRDVSSVVTKHNVVKGNAESLPFKDDTFELVLSLSSVPFMHLTELLGKYGSNPLEKDVEMMIGRVETTIREMIRVVKPGGEIRFAPGPASVNNPSDIDNYTLEGVKLMQRVFHEAINRVQQSEDVQFYFEPNDVLVDGVVVHGGYFRIINSPNQAMPDLYKHEPSSVEKFLVAVEDWISRKLK